MSSKGKKIVLAVLICSLAVAVYLNWQFPGEDFSSSTSTMENNDKNLGDTKLVNGTTTSPQGTTVKDKATGKPEVKEESTDKKDTEEKKEQVKKEEVKIEYFEDAKKKRGESRDEALAILREIIDNVKTEDADKSKAIEKITVIAENVECEANIENLIKAKGYSDAVAIIMDDEITVVVKEKELSSAQLAEIQEIALSTGRAKSDKIKIIPAK